jgi:type IV pilus assembly protein PilC
MRSFAIARFSWAFALTQQTGMPIAQSLEKSLRATSNGAYVAAIPQVSAAVNAGEDVVTALDETGLFPHDYLHIVRVGEESGTIPEQLDRLSPQFEDQARRSLSALATALGWLVWLAVAVFIVFMIFRLLFWYIGLLNAAREGTF